MKDLGRSVDGGYIVELSENEHNSLMRLIQYAGEGGRDYSDGLVRLSLDGEMSGWTDAIYSWLTQKKYLEEMRDGAIKMLNVLTDKKEG